MAGERYENRENKEKKEQETENQEHFRENDKYKLKPNETYVAGEGHYEYKTDRRGRIKECSGTLELHPENERNNYAQHKAGGGDRLEKDEGGHLFGRRFGGSGEIDNLVAQDGHLNRTEYKAMEDHFEEKLKEKDENGEQKYDVNVKIRVEYNDEREGTGSKDLDRPSDIYVYSEVKERATNMTTEYKLYHFKNQSEDNTRIRNIKAKED